MHNPRRVWLCAVVYFLCATMARAETYKLEEPVDDTRVFGVGVRVEVTGKIQHSPTAEPVPLSASAALSFRERRLLGPGSEAEALRSVRDYEQTSTEVNTGGQKSNLQLGNSLKLIVAQGRSNGIEVFSLGGCLTSSELELLNSPADSLALIALLPAMPVEIGESWTVPAWAFQTLAMMDATVKGELKCTLASVDKQVARIKMAGKVEGAAQSAISEITIEGTCEYDLGLKCISRCDITQTEKRSRGPVSPAFEFSARVALLKRPAQVPGRLADQKVIESAINEPLPTAKNLRFESPWNIGLEHPRHWHMAMINEKAAIFRLIDDGNLIAQCDLAPIPPAKPGEHLSEAIFVADIQKALGDRVKSISKGEVISTTDGRYVYRTAASGSQGDQQLVWIFYLITDPSGRQATLSVSVDATLVEALANREREFLNIRFGPAPVTPTPRTTSR